MAGWLEIRISLAVLCRSLSRPVCVLVAWLLGSMAMAQAPQVPAAPQAPTTAQPRYVVVLDAAHGGNDEGATLGNGRVEKSFTLALSVKLRSLLAARGMQVVTTRESDVALEPVRRAEIANHARAQLCLILHASASGSGVHLYASSLEAAQTTRFIPWKTAQAGWVLRSVALTGVLNSSLSHAGFHVVMGRTSLPVLDSMTCPAVAVEVAPKSDSGQPVSASFDDPEYLNRIAAALAAAVVEWRAEAHPS